MITDNDNIIMIIGLAATGKTTLAEQLAVKFPEFKIFHTDHYLAGGLNELMSDVMCDNSVKKIIEGTMGYHMLKRGYLEGYFQPDLIIEVVATKATREQRCIERGTSTNLEKQDASLRNVWKEYFGMSMGLGPRYIQLNTEEDYEL